MMALPDFSLQHPLGLRVDHDCPVHVDVEVELLAGALDFVRLQFRHDLDLAQAERAIGARAGGLDQIEGDTDPGEAGPGLVGSAMQMLGADAERDRAAIVEAIGLVRRVPNSGFRRSSDESGVQQLLGRMRGLFRDS